MDDVIRDTIAFLAPIIAFALITGFVVYLWKAELLFKWQMGAIFILLFLLMVAEIAVIALMFGKNPGAASIVILPVGIIGFIYAPFGMYYIYKLSKTLNIMWPLYFTLFIFIVLIVAGLKKFEVI